MDGYLNYKVNITSNTFLENYEISPNFIDSYEDFLSLEMIGKEDCNNKRYL